MVKRFVLPCGNFRMTVRLGFAADEVLFGGIVSVISFESIEAGGIF